MSRSPEAGFAMDGVRLDDPCTLLDFVRRRMDTLKKQRGRGGRGKYRSHPTPARKGMNHVVLVGRDQLFFRVLCRRRVIKAKAVEDSFRSTFVNVWNRIPEPDRRR